MRTTARLLGFTPPPATLRLKLIEGPYHWSLYLQPEGSPGIAALVEWLERWSPLRIEFGSRDVLRADLDPLPPAWSSSFRGLDLQMLILHPDGTAIATVSGAHAALAALGRKLAADQTVTDVRQVNETPRDAPLLTRAQDDALRAAIDAGYYQIPRPINLQQLAAKMGLSAASLSERLRRAEGRIILRYAQEGATTPWDARTLFDPRPPEAYEQEKDDAPTHPVRT